MWEMLELPGMPFGGQRESPGPTAYVAGELILPASDSDPRIRRSEVRHSPLADLASGCERHR
jgi:hypothetical protein